MNPLIKRLHEQRTNAELEIRSVLDQADAEKRDLTGEDEAKIEALDETSRSLNEHLGQLIEAEDRSKAVDDLLSKYGKPADPAKPEAPSDAAILRSMVNGERRAFDFAPTGSMEHRAPNTSPLSKLSAGAGANTVPTSFYDTIIEAMLETSTTMQAGATVLNTAGGENLQVPTAASASYPAAALIAEADPITVSDPVFGQATLSSYKYAFLMQASSELLADTGVDLVGFLGRRGGEALGNGIGAAFITGTGSSQPTGIAGSAGFTTVASASGSAAAGFTYDDVITLIHSITRPYRTNASFICNDSVTKTLRKLREGSGTGAYLWQPSMQAGLPDVLGGYPVYTDPAMPTATTTTGKGLAFGDWSKGLMIRIAGGVRVEVSTDYAFNTDLTTWRFITRADSKIVDAAAARVLTYLT
jgi:HK97 family phage major capsid protein